MNDLDLLYIISNKTDYNRFSKFIHEHLVSKETWTIIQDLEEWYEDNDELDWDKFSSWFRLTKHVMFKPDKMSVFVKIFERIAEYEPEDDDDLISKIRASLLDRDCATKLADISLAISEGSDSHDMDQVYQTIEEYEKEADRAAKGDSDVLTFTFEDFMAEVEDKGGLSWQLPELQEAVGNIDVGDFIAIASYSGNGKTTLLCDSARGWVDQIEDDECILWFNNEEAGKKVGKRFYQSYVGMEKEDIKSNPLAAQKAFDKISHKFKLVDDAGLTIRDMERIISNHNPRVIIVDQLWKVYGYENSSSNDVARIGSIYNWGREIAKKYAPVIAVHQADATSAGQKWIEKNQLHMSKVGIVGELDALITLGKTHDPSEEFIRFLYTPKNKLTGMESYKSPIEIQPLIGRYKSLVYSP